MLFNLLPIGAYSVKVELQGFITQSTRLTVSTGDRARFDVEAVRSDRSSENVP